MSTVELIEYALRDAEVPMSDMLARALEQIESDIATAEQDSRQKQARIERLKAALGEIAWSNDSKWQSDRANAALEESK